MSSSVLIVEDELSLAEFLEMVIEESLGTKTEVISDGRAAMERLENLKTTPGLVILDMHLPGISGEQIFSKISEINAGLSESDRIRVFVCSADEQLCRLYLPVADRVFQKPITGLLEFTNAASLALTPQTGS